MLAIALSLLFGVIAFVALAEVHDAVTYGIRRGRMIIGELASDDVRLTVSAPRSRRLATHSQPAAA